MGEYQDFRFHSHDGLNLYARDYASEKTGATVICIPGLTRNSADFAQLAEHLCDRFRVLAVDLRGRGNSDYDPDPANYHPGVYVQDITALIDVLALKKVILIGSSLGGLVSIILAAMTPERIAAVVLNDIGPQVNPTGLARIKSYVCNPKQVENWSQAVARTRAIHGAEFPDFSQGDWVTFTANLYRENPGGRPVLAYDPAIAQLLTRSDESADLPDLWPLFAAIPEMPIMLIRGALSDIITPQMVDKMREMRPGLNVVEVENRGHAPLLTEPVCIENIDRLLNEVAKKSMA